MISLLYRLIHTQSKIYKQASHQCYAPRLGNFAAPHPVLTGITTFICLWSPAHREPPLRQALFPGAGVQQEKAWCLFLGEQCGKCCGCAGGSPCPPGVRGRAFQKKHLRQILEEKWVRRVVCSVPSGLCLQYHVISPLLSFQPCSPLCLGFSPWCFASFLLLWKGNRWSHQVYLVKNLQSSSQLQRQISGRRTCWGGACMCAVSSHQCTDGSCSLQQSRDRRNVNDVTPLCLEKESRGPEGSFHHVHFCHLHFSSS